MAFKITPEEDRDFMAVLVKDIAYFHSLFAKDKDRRWLEIAKTLGGVVDQIGTRLKSLSP